MKAKKTVSLILALVMVFALCAAVTSCSDKKKYNIGICQLVTHDALDAATKGFKDAVVKRLGEENVAIDFQNAANDTQTCNTIINSFVAKNVDLIMANATPVLQAAANATETIPILGTSITEYGVALDIKNFSGVVGSNISGTSDLAPLTEQADMIIELFPDAKKVGLLYCSSEANSEYQVKVVEDYLKGKGLECTRYSFSDSNDVATITENAAANSDVIYIPTDNTASSCGETINGIVSAKKVPVISGEEGQCRLCGLVTLSISYYEIGYKTGEMAADILEGKQEIEKMEIAYDPNPVKKYNKKLCETLGMDKSDLEAKGYVAID